MSLCCVQICNSKPCHGVLTRFSRILISIVLKKYFLNLNASSSFLGLSQPRPHNWQWSFCFVGCDKYRHFSQLSSENHLNVKETEALALFRLNFSTCLGTIIPLVKMKILQQCLEEACKYVTHRGSMTLKLWAPPQLSHNG